MHRIGRVAETAGDLTSARNAYTEQLALNRVLRDAQPDAIETARDLSISLNSLSQVLSALGDLTGALNASTEQLALTRSLYATQPDAIQPARDLAYSLKIAAEIVDHSEFDRRFELHIEERDVRARIFDTLRDFHSAHSWANVDLRIDRLLFEHTSTSLGSAVYVYHRNLLQEIKTLLTELNNAQPLPEDLRADLDRVQGLLADSPDIE